MDFSFIQQLDRPYAGFPLWMWVTGGAVIAGVGYHFYRAKAKATANANVNPSDLQSTSPEFNYPQTLDQTSQTGTTDATVANLPAQDYWPYNQLLPMSSLALPSYPGNLYNPIMTTDSTGQQTQVLYG
jgi:hypothetical protein